MNPANTYENVLQYLDSYHMPGIWMCGLLFAPPKTKIGKSIMDRLDDWHHRSGDNFDFFCVGYVDYDEFDSDEPVGKLTDRENRQARQFYYSSQAFNEIRAHVEAKSSWKYSGEADLLLVNAVQPEIRKSFSREYHPRTYLALDEIVALDIDKIISDDVFSSSARLMERVCQAADEAAMNNERVEVMSFSDREFSRTLLRKGLGAIISKLKIDAPLSARHFLVGGHHLNSIA